jgi:hypothetical protein
VHACITYENNTIRTPQAVSDYNAHVLACAGKKPEAEKEQILLHQVQVLIKLLPACNRATLTKVVEMCEKVRQNVNQLVTFRNTL